MGNVAKEKSDEDGLKPVDLWICQPDCSRAVQGSTTNPSTYASAWHIASLPELPGTLVSGSHSPKILVTTGHLRPFAVAPPE